MPAINLDDLSLPELTALQSDIEKAITGRREAEKTALRNKMEAMAAECGFSFDELIEVKKPKGKRGTVKPKYRNPENPDETWTGRGKRPKWAVAFVEAGNVLEDALIGE